MVGIKDGVILIVVLVALVASFAFTFHQTIILQNFETLAPEEGDLPLDE